MEFQHQFLSARKVRLAMSEKKLKRNYKRIGLTEERRSAYIENNIGEIFETSRSFPWLGVEEVFNYRFDEGMVIIKKGIGYEGTGEYAYYPPLEATPAQIYNLLYNHRDELKYDYNGRRQEKYTGKPKHKTVHRKNKKKN